MPPYVPAVPIGTWDMEKGALVRQHQDPAQGPQRPVPVLPILREYPRPSAITVAIYSLGRVIVDKFTSLRSRAHRPAQTPEQQIIGLVAYRAAQIFRVEVGDIFSSTRGESLAGLARQAVMYTLHVSLQWAMPDIGQAFGRDRTTVSYACRLIEDTRDNAEFDGMMAQLDAFASALRGDAAPVIGAAA